MGKKEIPEIGWESWVHRGKDSDEMIFERANGAFGSVRAVIAGRLKLGGDFSKA